jgi:hypothetical protein
MTYYFSEEELESNINLTKFALGLMSLNDQHIFMTQNLKISRIRFDFKI